MTGAFPFETATCDLADEVAGAVVLALLDRSCWFDGTPLPDARWRILIKPENRGLVREVVGRVGRLVATADL